MLVGRGCNINGTKTKMQISDDHHSIDEIEGMAPCRCFISTTILKFPIFFRLNYSDVTCFAIPLFSDRRIQTRQPLGMFGASSLQFLPEDFPSSILPRREVDVVAGREDGFDVIPREYSLAALPRPVHPNRLPKEMSQFVSQ